MTPDPTGTSEPADLVQALVRELLDVLAPVRAAAASQSQTRALLDELGWDADALLGATGSNLQPKLADVEAEAGKAAALLTTVPATLDDARGRLAALGRLCSAVAALAGALPQDAAPLPTELLEHLLLRHLNQRRPLVWRALVLLGVVDVASFAAIVASGKAIRREIERPVLRPGRLGDVIADPPAYLRARYLPAALATTADAAAVGPNLLAPIADLLEPLGVESLVGRGLGPPTLSNARERQLAATMTSSRRFPIEDGLARLGATLSMVAADRGGPGVFVVPFGATTLSWEGARWRVRADVAGAGLGGALVTRDKTTFVKSATAKELGLSVELSRVAQEGGGALRLGGQSGTRLVVADLAVRGFGRLAAASPDYGLEAEARGGRLVLAFANGDGFLAKALPPDELVVDFELLVGWARSRRLYFGGRAGLEYAIPLHRALGPLLLDTLHLGLVAPKAVGSAQGRLEPWAALTARFELGPVKASIQKVGLRGIVTFPAGGGNLGPANLALDFKPPTGMGLSIAAGPVGGGGFIEVDEDAGQYAGALQLDLKVLSLKAVGVLATKMPDGSEGWSLIVIVAAEFSPIQLGFGFTLNGVGGLVGINRTIDTAVLAAGMADGSLDSIRFPKDVVKNAPRIIADIRQAFPIARGRYVFGPMVAVGWGTPTIFRLELGLILELPAPVLLVILGKLTATLPNEQTPAVLLQLDLLGVLDISGRKAWARGTLRDSRLGTLPLTGELAMDASWGATPAFAASAGGFNPRFLPPPGFPQLKPLALQLTTGDNPRLRLEAYLAVTANSIQLGAHLDLFARQDLGPLGDYTVTGWLGFDAFMRLVPFAFAVDFRAGVTLKRNGQALCTILLELTLTGPEPLHAAGQATFELLKIKRTIPVDVTLGPAATPAELPPADPEARLLSELIDARNWSATAPAEERVLVALRQRDPTEAGVLVHPIGELAVRQRVVPLDLDLQMYGHRPLSGLRRFEVRIRPSGGAPLDTAGPRDLFAPGEFFELSDDEKLTRPAFESFASGRRVMPPGTKAGATRKAALAYKTVQLQPQAEPMDLGEQALPGEALSELTAGGAVARAALRTTGEVGFRGPAREGIAVGEPQYVVADAETLAAAGTPTTYTEAAQARAQLDAAARSGRADVQVVGAHEVDA